MLGNDILLTQALLFPPVFHPVRALAGTGFPFSKASLGGDGSYPIPPSSDIKESFRQRKRREASCTFLEDAEDVLGLSPSNS